MAWGLFFVFKLLRERERERNIPFASSLPKSKQKLNQVEIARNSVLVSHRCGKGPSYYLLPCMIHIDRMLESGAEPRF